jgi:hypothetical protein
MPDGEINSYWVLLMLPVGWNADYLAIFPEPEECAQAPMGDLYSDYLTQSPADGMEATEHADTSGSGTGDRRDDAIEGPTTWDGDPKAHPDGDRSGQGIESR